MRRAGPFFFTMTQITTNEPLTALGLTIQMSIAPVFLFSGVAAFLAVLNSRLSRVIDRTRVLDARSLDDEEDAREMRSLFHRRKVINWAITLCTLSALCVALVVLLMFLGIVVDFPLGSMVAALFVTAMITLITAMLCFLHEVRAAVRHTRRATRHH